jgi:hypothetical protein
MPQEYNPLMSHSFLALWVVSCTAVTPVALNAQESHLTLAELLTPTSIVRHHNEPVRFALHWFIEFETLGELFSYIDNQAGQWEFDSVETKRTFVDDLLLQGLESRVISLR